MDDLQQKDMIEAIPQNVDVGTYVSNGFSGRRAVECIYKALRSLIHSQNRHKHIVKETAYKYK